MSMLLELDGANIDTVLLKHAGERYKEFVGEDVYNESYKWDRLGELNRWHEENEISENNVQDYIKYLQKINPNTGSFTHWSDLDHLNKFSESDPHKAAEMLNTLYYGEGSISERIDSFRSTLDEIEDVRIGSSTFGYLFAALDKDKFPIYKDGMFRDFIDDFLDNMDFKRKGMSIGDKYGSYLELCYVLRDYFYEQGLFSEKSALYAQDFMFVMEQYRDIQKEDIFLRYLFSFSKRLKDCKDDTDELIGRLKELPEAYLKSQSDKYEGTEKIKLIRYQVLKKILNGVSFDLEEIKAKVSEKYETNILQSWIDFSILGQIYFDYFKTRLQGYFEHLGEYLVENIDIDGLKHHIVTFQGSQNFLTEKPWILIYPEERGSHRDSYQFFFRILPKKIEYGFSTGEEIEDPEFEGGEKYVEAIEDMDDLSLDRIIDRYNSFSDEFLKKNKLEGDLQEEVISMEGFNCWQFSPGRSRYGFWPIFSKNSLAAIGDAQKGSLEGLSKKEVAYLLGKKEKDNDTRTTYNFVNKVETGDIIVAKVGKSNKVYGIGVVTGDYFRDIEKAEDLGLVGGRNDIYGNFRPVDWVIDLVDEYGETIEVDLDTEFVLFTLSALEKERYMKIKKQLVEMNPSLEDDFEELERYTFAEDKDFREVFLNEQDEMDARRYFQKLFDYIDYTDDLESILSVTYKGPRKQISVNFGRWKLFSIERRGEDYLANFAVDTSKLPQEFTDWTEYTENKGAFTTGEDHELIQFLWTEDILRRKPELNDAWKSAIRFARNIFKDYKSTPYRKSHREDIYDWIMGESEISVEGKTNYFWITANPKIWNVSKIKDGGTIFYTAYNQRGNKRRIFDAFEKAKPGDKVIFYESTPVKKIVAEGEITEGMHYEEEEGFDEPVEGIRVKYSKPLNNITWFQLKDIPDLEDSKPISNGAQGSIFELTKKEFETILALEPEPEVEEIDKEEILLEIHRSDLDIGSFDLDGDLYFPSGVWKEIEMSIASALRSGKNIIFTGPPGTGKTKIAKKVAEHIKGKNEWNDDFIFTTATADWTTFDTIGGYYPSKEGGGLEFKPGLFLSCFKDTKGMPINKWLIIDEINRADIDKAFGQLFSVLSNDSVELPFNDDEENQISIVSLDSGDDLEYDDSSFYVTRNWRLLATMNSYDKSSLYEMSYAFMRRFAFIDVGVPSSDELDMGLMKDYIECWNDVENVDDEDVEKVLEIWKTLIDNNRAIGPAIIKDILGFISANGGGGILTALKLFVLPQFEGMVRKNQKGIIEALGKCVEGKQELYKVARDRFDLELKEDE